MRHGAPWITCVWLSQSHSTSWANVVSPRSAPQTECAVMVQPAAAASSFSRFFAAAAAGNAAATWSARHLG